MASATCGDFTSIAGTMEYTDTSHGGDSLGVELMFSNIYLLNVSPCFWNYLQNRFAPLVAKLKANQGA
jgi:hypothetical protein